MRTIKFKSEDRDYKCWNIYSASSLQELNREDYNIDPAKDKLLHQDIFKVDEDGKVTEILHSSNREMKIIPGVIVFDKMYGKYKNKFLYKVIPDDRRLPIFLVPYKPRKVGFEKKMDKKYIIFKYKDWNGKHPCGEIVLTIGCVKELSNFYEYQLYCKSLNASIQDFTKKAKSALRKRSEDELTQDILSTPSFNIEDRRDWDIITIDPLTSRDFDDGFGFKKLETIDGKERSLLSIYISNVSVWMEYLNLWTSFTERISTIYLPDKTPKPHSR